MSERLPRLVVHSSGHVHMPLHCGRPTRREIDCPLVRAGWTGDDCKTRQRRPCAHRWRIYEEAVVEQPAAWSEPGWAASRCAGGSCAQDHESVWGLHLGLGGLGAVEEELLK
jgi:hypothetical protein